MNKLMNLPNLPNEYKKIALTYLFKNINLYKIRYQIINDKNNLNEIKTNKYYITSHIQGLNFLLLMIKIKDKNYNILISKKELRYNLEQNNINDLKMYYFELNNINDEYYNGTIFDGRIIKNNIMLIQECYIFNSINMLNINLQDKFKKINKCFDYLNNNLDNLNFKLCDIYEYKDSLQLINSIKTSEFKINGFIFLPYFTNPHYIYVNDNEFEIFKNKTFSINASNIKSNNLSHSVFLMKKTNIPDVYELFNVNDINIKEGIAHIPNIKSSHFFRDLFKKKNMIQVPCLKSEKFNKWVPINDDYIDYSNVIF
jgi:hypothetical protein